MKMQLVHGVDLVEVDRIARMLEEHRERFLNRCFTPAEQAYSMSKKNASEHLAARFAAKEAVLKALGTGLSEGMQWIDVEVVSDVSGAPRLALHGVAQSRSHSLRIASWVISLSHTQTMAMASVIGVVASDVIGH